MTFFFLEITTYPRLSQLVWFFSRCVTRSMRSSSSGPPFCLLPCMHWILLTRHIFARRSSARRPIGDRGMTLDSWPVSRITMLRTLVSLSGTRSYSQRPQKYHDSRWYLLPAKASKGMPSRSGNRRTNGSSVHLSGGEIIPWAKLCVFSSDYQNCVMNG